MQKYPVAEKLFLTALKLSETVFGEFSKQVGKLNYLLLEPGCGNIHPSNVLLSPAIHWLLGNMRDARPYCERSLEIRERVLGSHHLDVAMSLCGLGGATFFAVP